MKRLLVVLVIFVSSNIFAQSGVYVIDHTNDNIDGTKTKWTLSLEEDGTFLYHFLRDLSAVSKANTEENFYGKGTWKAEKNLIFFYSDKETDLDEKHKINFTGSKARYITPP